MGARDDRGGGLDGDGFTDVVSASVMAANAAVLRALRDAKFRTPEVYPVGIGPVPVVIADLFGNGTPDLVVGSSTGPFPPRERGPLRGAASSAGTCEGTGANIRVLAGGFGPVTYQWRKDGVALAEVAPFSGVTAPVLIISPTATAAGTGTTTSC